MTFGKVTSVFGSFRIPVAFLFITRTDCVGNSDKKDACHTVHKNGP